MMLEQCRRDFSALIDRINVQDAFEKAGYNDRYNTKKSPHDRPITTIKICQPRFAYDDYVNFT